MELQEIVKLLDGQPNATRRALITRWALTTARSPTPRAPTWWSIWAGLRDAFTITCITDQDVAVAQHYFRALGQQADQSVLWEILAQAPLCRHYHQPTDTHEKLSEAVLAMTAHAVWETILA